MKFCVFLYPEAYKCYINGIKAFAKIDYPSAIGWLSKSVEVDTNFFYAMGWLTLAYRNNGMHDQGKKWCIKAYKKRDQMPEWAKIWISSIYSDYFETPYQSIPYLIQLLELDDQFPLCYYQLGSYYRILKQYEKAIPELEKALEIYKRWDSKPFWAPIYSELGIAYHNKGLYKKEKKLYKKAVQDFPNYPGIISRQAILSLSEGDSVDANRHIERFKSISKENLVSEASITTDLGYIYSEAGILAKAGEYYQKALSLEPKSSWRMYILAYFLIDKEQNITEGMELIDKALVLDPNIYQYLNCKGWGLYKQGKYKEALVLLDSSWNLRSYSLGSMSVYFHLEAVKKAVASQK